MFANHLLIISAPGLVRRSALWFCFSLTFEGRKCERRSAIGDDLPRTCAWASRKRDLKRTWQRRLTVLNILLLSFRQSYDVHSDVCRTLSFTLILLVIHFYAIIDTAESRHPEFNCYHDFKFRPCVYIHKLRNLVDQFQSVASCSIYCEYLTHAIHLTRLIIRFANYHRRKSLFPMLFPIIKRVPL